MTTRAPKTRTAPVPTTPEDDGVLRISTSSNPPVEEARELLFVIDDDEFTVPKLITPRMVFLGLDMYRRQGPMFGAMYVTELVLGDEQYGCLIDHYKAKRITQDQFDQVVQAVSALFFDQSKRAGAEGEEAGKALDALTNS